VKAVPARTGAGALFHWRLSSLETKTQHELTRARAELHGLLATQSHLESRIREIEDQRAGEGAVWVGTSDSVDLAARRHCLQYLCRLDGELARRKQDAAGHAQQVEVARSRALEVERRLAVLERMRDAEMSRQKSELARRAAKAADIEWLARRFSRRNAQLQQGGTAW
jgi:flagellar export protein FliJ